MGILQTTVLAWLTHSVNTQLDELSLVQAQVMGWVSGYQATLRELGLDDEDVNFPSGANRGVSVLISKYTDRMHATLQAWFVNILEVRTMHQPELRRDPQAQSVDMTSILNAPCCVPGSAEGGMRMLGCVPNWHARMYLNGPLACSK